MTKRRGFTLVELLICVAIVVVIATVAVPYLTGALQTTGETAALQNIRTVHTAQAQFFATRHRFAGKLDEFGPKELSAALRDGTHNGYDFRLELTNDGYAIYASPAKGAKLGQDTFYSDETLVVRRARGEQAGPASPPVE
jgi:prepilin-type N-terminal cleavage/methylation domain-containing protein